MQEGYRSVGFARLCFERLLPLVVLNILFLLTCLPVLTASAGWTALCSACQGLLLDEKQPYRRFWRAFRVNFLPSLLLGVIFFAGPAAVLYGCWFYFRLSERTGFAAAISCFCLICAPVTAPSLFCSLLKSGGTLPAADVVSITSPCPAFPTGAGRSGTWAETAPPLVSSSEYRVVYGRGRSFQNESDC